MIEKIKGCFVATAKKLPSFHFSAANLWIIYTYGLCCGLLLVCFLGGWGYEAVFKSNLDLKIMKDMFDSLTDPQVVAAVTFVAVFSVDKDGDGTSDEIEKRLSLKDKPPI